MFYFVSLSNSTTLCVLGSPCNVLSKLLCTVSLCVAKLGPFCLGHRGKLYNIYASWTTRSAYIPRGEASSRPHSNLSIFAPRSPGSVIVFAYEAALPIIYTQTHHGPPFQHGAARGRSAAGGQQEESKLDVLNVHV